MLLTDALAFVETYNDNCANDDDDDDGGAAAATDGFSHI